MLNFRLGRVLTCPTSCSNVKCLVALSSLRSCPPNITGKWWSTSRSKHFLFLIKDCIQLKVFYFVFEIVSRLKFLLLLISCLYSGPEFQVHHLSCHSVAASGSVSLTVTSPPKIKKCGHARETEVASVSEIKSVLGVVKGDADKRARIREEREDMAHKGANSGDGCVKKEKIYACNFEDCKVMLSSKDSLSGHIRNMHKKKTSFECSQCLKKFKKRANLKRHNDAVHEKLKPFQCEKAGCMKKFATKDWLKRHIKMFHLKDRPHVCLLPGCGEMFAAKINLKRHMMKIHNFEKPHLCVEKDCNKRFEERRHLEDHMRSVHGAQKLACDVDNCTATFIYAKSLYGHKFKYGHKMKQTTV